MTMGLVLRKRQVRAYALGTSAIALGMVLAGPAFAQCAPDPTVSGGTTNCTGTDEDGLTVSATNTTVNVVESAIVRAGTAEAAITAKAQSTAINVAGLVDGGSQAGIWVTTDEPYQGPCDPYAGASIHSCTPGSTVTYYPVNETSINIARGGSITGANAILVRRATANTQGYARAYIDNYGSIIGTDGDAIYADPANSQIINVNNYQSGTITGGIYAPVRFLNNTGEIDGGARSAAASTFDMIVNNSGTIISNGAPATLSSTGPLTISNTEEGVIGGSATAISAEGPISLTNEGTINGSVVVLGANGLSNSIDTRKGTINGNVMFSNGRDTLYARFDPATGRTSSITGSIDGGAGIDTISFDVSSDITLAQTVLPTNFERLGLNLSNDATVTIADGFNASGGIVVSGSGYSSGVINNASFNTSGTAVTVDSPGLSFENVGTIAATPDGWSSYAVNVESAINSGTITGSYGGGISSKALNNSGTIRADNVGANVRGKLTNSGSIISNSTTGLNLSPVYSIESTNSGTIQGADVGLYLSGGTLTNSGTIVGGNTGVQLWGTLINAPSGTVTGGTFAIKGMAGGTRIANAGTINGTVDLTPDTTYDFSADIFFDDGGVVNGAIRLGGGDDQLIVSLGADSARPLAGATGGVDAGDGYDTLRYLVSTDADAALALTDGFEALAYELSDDAALTLTASSPLTTTIGLAGNGSVTLNGTISTSDRSLIDASILTAAQLTKGTAGPTRDLIITNAGDLTLSITDDFYGYGAGVINAAGSAVANSGTITVNNTPGNYNTASAVFSAKTFDNSGTITVTGGGTALTNIGALTNSGTIVATGDVAMAVNQVTDLRNSGLIRAEGDAVRNSYGSVTITNSGTIESLSGNAVYMSGYDSSLVNEATGTIRGSTAVDISSGGTIVNRGTIDGDVWSYAYSYGPAIYIADGGTLNGNLTFGMGDDMLILFGADSGVSGTIDGGEGTNTIVHAHRENATVNLGTSGVAGFERAGAAAIGADTEVTIAADTPYEGDLLLFGDGKFVNAATIMGQVSGESNYLLAATLGLETGTLSGFTNEGAIDGGFSGAVANFVNSGTIGKSELEDAAVSITAHQSMTFDNSGTIDNYGGEYSVYLRGYSADTITATNSGTMTGGIEVEMSYYDYRDPVDPVGQLPSMSMAFTNSGTITGEVGMAMSSDDYADRVDPLPPMSIAFTNSGAISSNAQDDTAVWMEFGLSDGQSGSATLTNSGTITATGANASGVDLALDSGVGSASFTVDNSGTIQANGGGTEEVYYSWWDDSTYRYTEPSVGLSLRGADAVAVATITNSGTIEATGERSVAIMSQDAALDVTNSGTIRGGGDTVLAADDQLAYAIGTPYLASAIQTIGEANDRVVNNGTIIGSIALGAGDDRVENYGNIDGNVFLGEGDDTFLQRAAALLSGTVDGGAGTDGLIIDATGGGTVNSDQFVNFESFTQIGQGDVVYSGDFAFDTIGLSGGTISVGAGETLSSAGAVTITGGDGGETVDNRGTIAGGVMMGGGDDRVANRGVIEGDVELGSGNDVFVDYSGSNAVTAASATAVTRADAMLSNSSAGLVDGGTGTDLYQVVLSGDRSGIGRRIGFEELGVEGSGTLTLDLDQRFDRIMVSGAGLTLTTGDWTVGQISGSDAAETLNLTGNVAAVQLGGGDDRLTLNGMRGAGAYSGGAGNDMLGFTATGPVQLTGSATGFEQISLAGGKLIVAGTLGQSGDTLGFGDGAQQLTVTDGGTLGGAVDLGNGDDMLVLQSGSRVTGTVSGGSGADILAFQLTGDAALGNNIRDFEALRTSGTGTLTLTGAQAFGAVAAGTDLAIGTGATLTADQVTFGDRDDAMTIAGGFAGSVDGGAGTDRLTVSGGSESAPILFRDIAHVEQFAQESGFAALTGTASFTNFRLSGGRFVGKAGSMLSADRVIVDSQATFGSAGTVNGNVTVFGTLSPGASVATMTVNGNVALAAGSTSLFEIDESGADKLIVNGSLTIDQGTTLQLEPTGTVRPGQSYDLILASGGITGQYSKIVKPDSLFGFVVQRADRIQLLGEFRGDARFSPQVARAIAYTNGLLARPVATSGFYDVVPLLAREDGSSDAQGFAALTPEAYASATQAGVEDALTVADAARGPAFGTQREAPGFFTFAQSVGQWRTLGADRQQGTAQAHMRGYGFLGGVGYGDATFSVGGFAGYMNMRQEIDAIEAQTKNDEFVAGIHARYAENGIGLAASFLYDGGKARTTRVVAGRNPVEGRYDLHSWVADLSGSYAIGLTDSWALNAKAGATVMRTNRDRVSEAGSPLALDVLSDSHVSGFVDGGIMVARGDASPARFRPFVGLGVRYQVEGRRAEAVGRFAGGPFTLEAVGAQRAAAVATASAGVSYRLKGGIDLFATASAQSGRDDHQQSASAGMRVRF